MGKREREGGRKLPPYLFTFMQAINYYALCTASIDRFTVAMEIFINSSGIAEMALFCQQEEGGSLFFAFCYRQSILLMLLGLIKECVFSY